MKLKKNYSASFHLKNGGEGAFNNNKNTYSPYKEVPRNKKWLAIVPIFLGGCGVWEPFTHHVAILGLNLKGGGRLMT